MLCFYVLFEPEPADLQWSGQKIRLDFNLLTCYDITSLSILYIDPNNPSSTDHLHGVAMYTSNKLPASEVFFSKYLQEQIWLTLKLRGHNNLLVGCLCRSPSSDIQQSTAFYVIYLNLSMDTPTYLFVVILTTLI